MSKAKHVICLQYVVIEEGTGYMARCACDWCGATHLIRESFDARACRYATRIDGLQHAIEVVMAMPMLPDEYRSQFEFAKDDHD